MGRCIVLYEADSGGAKAEQESSWNRAGGLNFKVVSSRNRRTFALFVITIKNRPIGEALLTVLVYHMKQYDVSRGRRNEE